MSFIGRGLPQRNNSPGVDTEGTDGNGGINFTTDMEQRAAINNQPQNLDWDELPMDPAEKSKAKRFTK